MEFHEYANIFPMMAGEEFQNLVKDIKDNGLQEPIYLHQNRIIDGRNRFKACQEAEVEPRFQEWDGKGDLLAFIISKNLHRRHLQPSEAAAVAVSIKEIWKEQAKQKQTANLKRGKESSVYLNSDKRSEDPVHCNIKAAKLMGVGHDSVAKASKVKKKGVPEVFDAMAAGKLSVNTAAEISELPHDEQRQILQEPIEKIRETARTIKKGRKAVKIKEDEPEFEPMISEPVPMEPKAYGEEVINNKNIQNKSTRELTRAITLDIPNEGVVLTICNRKGGGIWNIFITEKTFEETVNMVSSIFPKESNKNHGKQK